MSVSGERISEQKVLAVLDTGARKTVTEAQRELAPIVSRETPRGRTGKTAAALRPKVSKTSTGAALTISVPRGKLHSGQATIADVVRWVNRGTGIHRRGGGPKAKIHASKPWGRMTLPGGAKRYSVEGQRANPFMDRIRHIGSPRVERTFKRGADKVARAIERVF